MAFPLIHARLVISCDMPNGQNAQNVYWYESNTDPGEPNFHAQALATAANAAFKPLYAAAMCSTGHYSGVYAEVYNGNLVGTYDLGDPQAGGNPTPAAPNYVAALIVLRTEIPGASGRGRRYIPNVAAGFLLGNVLAPLDPWTDLTAQIIANLNVGGNIWQPRHKYTVAGENFLTPITYAAVDTHPATMKSRQVS